MSKATYLAELYRQSVQEYTKTPQEWKGLLSCLARFYKRPFDNVVLIYAQRPDATQLGTFDEWHDKRIGRSINKGAKGIAVIDMTNPNASIKYLFDFMDTNGSVQSYRKLQKYLWELEEEYRPEIMHRFKERYSVSTNNIETCIYKLVNLRVRQWLPPYLENFNIWDESSPLYGMPEQAVKAEFMELVTDSVAYAVYSKCGISTEMFEESCFENISNYNRIELFMALGNCTVSIARPILKEIYQEIQRIKIERSGAYEKRTLDEIHLQTRQGWTDVSGSTDFKQFTDRPDSSGPVRQFMERLHDGDASTSFVGAGGGEQDQRNYPAGGRGSGTEQGETDSGVTDRSTNARNRGHAGENRTHEYDNQAGRGNCAKPSSAESQITQSEPQTAQSPIIQPPTDVM